MTYRMNESKKKKKKTFRLIKRRDKPPNTGKPRKDKEDFILFLQILP